MRDGTPKHSSWQPVPQLEHDNTSGDVVGSLALSFLKRRRYGLHLYILGVKWLRKE